MPTSTERLHKLLAAAGLGSRRTCEELIRSGRVRVNGEVRDELPVIVDPSADRIVVDGKPLRPQRKAYYVLNKPRNVVCTQRDPQGRRRAVDLLVGVPQRVYPVGRLDADSQGLLLMTNDGELTDRLTHPRYGVPKTYRAAVKGALTGEDLTALQGGVWLNEGKTQPARIKLVHRERAKTILEITLREGRNRQVRRMLARLGHPVRRLVRVRMGPLTLGSLKSGQFRPLTPREIEYLLELTHGPGPADDGPPPRRRPRPAPRERRWPK